MQLFLDLASGPNWSYAGFALSCLIYYARLEVSHNVASTLELKSLLGLILEQLKVVAEYDGATITIVDGEQLVVIDYRGTGRESMLGWRFSLKQLGPIWEMIARREVVIVEDVYGETLLALACQRVKERSQETFKKRIPFYSVAVTHS